MIYTAFSKNSDFFESIVKDLKNAKEKIYIETYIFREDELGLKINDILIEKARNGCEVKLLIDAIGSLAISEFTFRELIENKGNVRFFRRILLLPIHLAKLNNRNHRKIAVIDDTITYIGSTNIDQQTAPWREFNLRIEHKDFNHVFSRIFIDQFLISNSLILNTDNAKEIHTIKDVEILRAVPFVFHSVREAFLDLVRNAKKTIVIENPYIVFDTTVIQSLRKAIKHGVKITIILPTRSDHNIVDYLNKKYMRKLKRMGVEILMYPKMLHSKIIIADDERWMFGSANFEYRSMFTQFEVMMKGTSGEIGTLIRRHITDTLAETKEHGKVFDGKITFRQRVIGNILYLVRFLF